MGVYHCVFDSLFSNVNTLCRARPRHGCVHGSTLQNSSSLPIYIRYIERDILGSHLRPCDCACRKAVYWACAWFHTAPTNGDWSSHLDSFYGCSCSCRDQKAPIGKEARPFGPYNGHPDGSDQHFLANSSILLGGDGWNLHIHRAIRIFLWSGTWCNAEPLQCLAPYHCALGNYLSSLLVTIISRITTRGGREQGWIPAKNLNVGHMDYFFWLLAVLSLLNLLAYIGCSRWYQYKRVHIDSDEKEQRSWRRHNQFPIQVSWQIRTNSVSFFIHYAHRLIGEISQHIYVFPINLILRIIGLLSRNTT